MTRDMNDTVQNTETGITETLSANVSELQKRK